MIALLRDEGRLLIRDRLMPVMLLALLASLLFAAISGERYRAQWQQSQAQLLEASRTKLDTIITDVRSAKPDDPKAFSPPGTPGSVVITTAAAVPPLAHFSIGQSDLYPRSADAGLRSRDDNLFKLYQIQSPLTLASGRFDLTYVIVAILPLLAIVLCFDLLAADWVSGRLSLLAVQAGGLGGLIARCLGLRGAVLMLPVALLFVWGLVSGAALLPLVIWTGLALLYALFWLLLCAVVAVRPARPETQAAQLVSIWLLLVLALPAGINGVVEALVPPPSQQTLVAELRAAEIRANLASDAVLQGYLTDHPELVAKGSQVYTDSTKKGVAVARNIEAETRPVLQAHEAQIARTRQTAHWLQFLSPAAALQVALSDAAGSGPEQLAAYVASVRAYKTRLQDAITPAIYRAEKLSLGELEALPVHVAPGWTPAYGGGLLLAVTVFLGALCGLLLWRLRFAAARLSFVAV